MERGECVVTSDNASVQATSDDIAALIARAILEVRALGDMTREYGRSSARLSQSSCASERVERQLLISKEFARELNESATRIDELDPLFAQVCDSLESAVCRVGPYYGANEAPGRNRPQQTVAILREARLPLIGAILEYERLREVAGRRQRTLNESIGNGADIDSRISAFIRSIGKLNTRLKQFESIANKYVEFYSTDSSDA